MSFQHCARLALAAGLALSLSACGGGLFQRGDGAKTEGQKDLEESAQRRLDGDSVIQSESSILELFTNTADPNTTVEVNKYIWQASLEVMNFLPIESVDPFTGVIVTGYGRPPGGGRAYRATIYVQDPALDARSLKIALQGQGGGTVAPETVRAVEDAILTRARQLRVRDSRL
jgi:Domain of unknown function (DUF3576)